MATVEVLVLTALAHAWAGGELPSPPWFGGLALVVFIVSALVLRDSLRVRSAVAMIALCQVGLHAAFEVGAAHASHAHHGAGSVDAGPSSVSMLLAHVLATIATAAILCLQDQASARVIAWLNRSAPVAMPVGPRVRVFTHVTDEVPKPLRVMLLRSPLRGPPAVAG